MNPLRFFSNDCIVSSFAVLHANTEELGLSGDTALVLISERHLCVLRGQHVQAIAN